MENLNVELMEELLVSSKKEEILQRLNPYSEAYYFVKILLELNKADNVNYLELEKQIKQFDKNINFKKDKKELLKLRYYFQKLEKDSEEDRKQTLKKINEKWLKLTFEHKKPENLNCKIQLKNDQEEDEYGFIDNKKLIQSNEKMLQKEIQGNNPEYILNCNEQFIYTLNIIPIIKRMEENKIEKLLNKCQNIFMYDKLNELLDYLKVNYKYNENLLYDGIWKKLTIQQLSQYIKDSFFNTRQIYLDHFMERKFKMKQLMSLSPESLVEEEKLIDEGLLLFSTFDEQLEDFYYTFLFLKLKINIQNNKVDQKLFTQYTKYKYKSKYESIQQEKPSLQKMVKQVFTGSKKASTINVKCNYKISESTVNETILLYLIDFIKRGIDVQQYEYFYGYRKMNELNVTTRLLYGLEVQNVNDIIGEEELKQLNDIQFIKLKNLKVEDIGDKSLKIVSVIKNIKNLKIKIFKINTPQYVLKHKDNNYQNLQTYGFSPIYEREVQFTQQAIIQHDEIFQFEEKYFSERGVYLFDFMGEDLHSRTVYFKGNLTLVQDQTFQRQFWIVDEVKNVCKGPNTGIYIADNYIKCDINTGSVYIPENVKSYNGKAIIKHKNYADVQNVSFKDDKLTLRLNILYNEDSINIGSENEFFVFANVFSNDQSIQNNAIVSNQLHITTINQQNIRSTKIINNAQMKEGNEQRVNLHLPQQTKKILFQWKSEIKCGDSIREVTQMKELKMRDENDNRLNQILFFEDGKNVLHIAVIGRNGECISKKQVKVHVQSDISQESDILDVMSDDNGCIRLQLTGHMLQIKVVYNSHNYYYTRIEKSKDVVQDFKIVLEEEADDIQIELENCDEMRLYQYGDGQQLQEELHNKIEKKADECYYVQNLVEGRYLLIGKKDCSQQMKIVVVRAKGMPNMSQKGVYYNDKYLFRMNRPQKLKLRREETHNNINYKIDADEKVSAFLLTFNYNGGMNNAMLGQQFLKQQYDDQQLYKLNVQKFKEVDDIFCQQKKVPQEQMYVQYRRTQQTFIGNKLDKPQLLLHRQKLRDITSKMGETSQGDNFINVQQQKKPIGGKCQNYENYDAQSFFVNSLRKSQIEKLFSNEYDINVKEFIQQHGKMEKLDTLNDFITVKKCDLQPYQASLLIVTDGKKWAIELLDQHIINLPKHDCRLRESKEKGTIYRYERKSVLVKEKENEVPDESQIVQKTEIRTQKELFDCFMTLLSNDNNKKDQLKEWEFLIKWDSLSPMEKLKYYDQFCGNELNLFLYFQDQTFFQEVILPHLKQKYDKKIIDYFLIGNNKEMKKYYDLKYSLSLNALELFLLILHGCQNNENIHVKHIANKIELLAMNETINDTKRKTVFDQILNYQGCNQMSDQKSQLQKPKPAPPGRINQIAQQAILSNIGNMNNMEIPVQNIYQELQQRVCNYEDEDSEEVCQQQDEVEYQQTGNEFEDQIVYKQCKGRGLRRKSVEGNSNNCSTTEYEERQYYFKEGIDKMDGIKYWDQIIKQVIEGNIDDLYSEHMFYNLQSQAKIIIYMALSGLAFKYSECEKRRKIVLKKLLIDKKAEYGEQTVVCSQRFYDPQQQLLVDDQDSSVKVELPVTQFTTQKLYQSRVVVSNQTNREQSITLITQIPLNSIPVNCDKMKIDYMQIKPFESGARIFQFYFPKQTDFKMYPATIVKDDIIVSVAQFNEAYTVLEQQSNAQMITFKDYLQSGNFDDILHFMATKNILNTQIFKFGDILWLLKDKSYYDRIINVLRDRGIFEQSVWSYSVYHNDISSVGEFLEQTKDIFFKKKVLHLSTKTLKIDDFKLYEYYPLVNNRSHLLPSIEALKSNNRLHETYSTFLYYLFQKGTISDKNWLLLASYQLAQDKIEMAKNSLSHMSNGSQKDQICEIQYEYLQAYLDFLTGHPEFEKANEICEKYLTYPVISWRNLFIEIANQLAEYEEKNLVHEIVKTNQNERNDKQLANILSAEIADNGIAISSQNIKKIIIKYHIIDIEAIYSQNPFNVSNQTELNITVPDLQEIISVADTKEAQQTDICMDDKLRAQSVYVQIFDEENSQVSVSKLFMQFKLCANIDKNSGIVKISDTKTKRPMPKIYCKSFIKLTNNKEQFLLDGYTDLRGEFNYGLVLKDSHNSVKELSLFLYSDEYGAQIHIIQPPEFLQEHESKAKDLISNTWINRRDAKQKMCKKTCYQNVI